MKNLLIGTFPPPIGGVTMFLKRLKSDLISNSIYFDVFDIKRDSFFSLVTNRIPNTQRIHIHVSNPYLRFMLVLCARIFFKEVILTIHGSLGRFSKLKNVFDKLAIILSSQSVVLNSESLKKARSFKKNVIQMSAFLPPTSEEILNKDQELIDLFSSLKVRFSHIFCTNASALQWDKYNNDIYGIFNLINVFNELPEKCLIILDPTGAYKKFTIEKEVYCSPNIVWVTKEKSFIQVIINSDCVIRNTTTDGDSISVREAIFLNKKVICTNCVSRPSGVILVDVNDNTDLKYKIEYLDNTPVENYINSERFSEFVSIFK